MYDCASAPPPRPVPPGAEGPPEAGASRRPEVDVSAYDGLAVAIARRFVRTGIEFDDLVQAARLGLVEAARRFDPGLGTAFTTYALPVVLGEVRRCVTKSRAVSGTRRAESLVHRARLAQQRLETTLGRPPAVSEVASELGVDPGELALAGTALSPAEPLDVGRVGLDDAEGLGAQGERLVDAVATHHALGALPGQLRVIVYLRFFAGWTQQEVANALGLSQPAVSRRERQALAQLRPHLEPGPR